MFLPISSTPQPERRKQPQHRRHSIEKETPTNVRLFQPPTKKNSKSLVSGQTFSRPEINAEILYSFFFFM